MLNSNLPPPESITDVEYSGVPRTPPPSYTEVMNSYPPTQVHHHPSAISQPSANLPPAENPHF